MLFASAAVLMVGCGKEDLNNGAAMGGGSNIPVITDDDTGIELNMRNGESDEIIFETNYIDNNGYIGIAKIRLEMTSSNNFIVKNYSSMEEYGIASVGAVSNMSAITSIPSSGWVKQIAVNPGTGYVIRYKGHGFGYTYARLYVKDWIVNTSGGIIGATIVYQDKWGEEEGTYDLSLFGTQYGTLEEWNTELNITLQFSASSFSGTMIWSELDSASGEYNNETISFTYTYYKDGNGNLTMHIPGISSSYWPTYPFVVVGDTLTLQIEDGVNIQLHKQ